jgi:hypothetical protein
MAKFINSSILFLAIFVPTFQAYEFWNDFRVTWGPSPMTAFTRLPRNTFDATIDGWTQRSTECLNGGRFSGFQWLNPSVNGIAILFDARGFAAGIQAMIPHSELLVPGSKLQYDKVPMYQNHTINGVDYFVITSYFVSPNLICVLSESDSGNIGARSLVYFQNGDSIFEYKTAPKNRTVAISQGWTKNNCIPTMGYHNFFEVEKYQPRECTEMQPTFILYNEFEEMIGYGVTFIGNGTSTRFEHPTSSVIQVILGDAPPCILEQTDLVGFTTLHVFFTNPPWLTTC